VLLEILTILFTPFSILSNHPPSHIYQAKLSRPQNVGVGRFSQRRPVRPSFVLSRVHHRSVILFLLKTPKKFDLFSDRIRLDFSHISCYDYKCHSSLILSKCGFFPLFQSFLADFIRRIDDFLCSNFTKNPRILSKRFASRRRNKEIPIGSPESLSADRSRLLCRTVPGMPRVFFKKLTENVILRADSSSVYLLRKAIRISGPDFQPSKVAE
jgi:hypothetical protein